jgi:hypothetical protein
MSQQQATTERQQYWLNHIEACQQQGISMKAYAQQSGIELRSLYDAKSRLVREGVLPRRAKSPFQKVKIKTVTASQCILHLPNGIELEWPTDGGAHSLAEVLKVVSTLG